jgi:hypothetical protein
MLSNPSGEIGMLFPKIFLRVGDYGIENGIALPFSISHGCRLSCGFVYRAGLVLRLASMCPMARPHLIPALSGPRASHLDNLERPPAGYDQLCRNRRYRLASGYPIQSRRSPHSSQDSRITS